MPMGKTSKKAVGKCGAKAATTKDILHFFKPKTNAVTEITCSVAAKKEIGTEAASRVDAGEFHTPIKRGGGSEATTSSPSLCKIAGEPERQAKEKRGAPGAVTKLGTPAQTYKRRKRPREEKVEEVQTQEEGLQDKSGGGGGGGGGVITKENNVRERDASASASAGPKKQKGDSTKLRQIYLDLGQSSFGHTTCTVCGLVYTKGEPADEKMHKLYHKECLKGMQKSELQEGRPV